MSLDELTEEDIEKLNLEMSLWELYEPTEEELKEASELFFHTRDTPLEEEINFAKLLFSNPLTQQEYDRGFRDDDGTLGYTQVDLLEFAGIPPHVANRYPEGFDAGDIISMHEDGIDPELAYEYRYRYGFYFHHIKRLPRGVNLDELTKNQIELLKVALDFIEDQYKERLDEKGYMCFHCDDDKPCEICWFNPEPPLRVITVGNSIILLNDVKERAYKFSDFDQSEHEYRILRQIEEESGTNLKNIIHIFGNEETIEPRFEGTVIELEYVKGKTLCELIKEQSFLSPQKVLKYGLDIFDGLTEMRKGKVWYHRDIRPANILIDEKKDKAIIIDFGIATTDKTALQKQNRRFGGAHDLISLGQVMYYMATGQHIFAQSESMTRTFSDIADEIADYRSKVYSDPTGKMLQERIEHVDKTIQDKRIRILVKACLTAKHYDYSKMQKMFKRMQHESG